MCKINGQSFFKWWYNPVGATINEVKRQKNKDQPKANKGEGLVPEATAIRNNEDTASKIQDKDTQKRNLSSLRIPLVKKSNTSTNAGGSYGLNIPM